MRTMLTGANLLLQYWSYAIQHACYIKNRLPHMSLPDHIIPFERFTNRRPDLSHLRIFGSHATIKQPRIRLNKLDTTHITTGIFLGFTSTNRNTWFEDSTTNEVKSAWHAVYNEAHYLSDNRPPYAHQLVNMVEEHLVDPTTRPTAAPPLPVCTIPNDTLSPPTTSNIPTIQSSPTPTSHQYPLCSKEKVTTNTPIQTTPPEQLPTTIVDPLLQSLPPIFA